MSTTNPQTNVSDRRSFLGILGSLFLGLIGVLTGTVGSMYAILPSFGKNQKESWCKLNSVDQIPNGISKHSVILNKQTGWATSQTEQIVWVVKENKSLNVFSAVCPHQGCIVNNQAAQFVCLCHMSKWTVDGTKAEGPSPRNLDKLDHRITNDNLEVNYQSFKVGVPEKIPLA